MNMEMKQYWPQHKVFFIATLALFPERLRNIIITELFYKPYFPRDEIAYIEIMLNEYRKDSYIEYEESGQYAYKLTKIDTQKATADLTEYLKKWQRSELLLLPASKPPDVEHQQTFLLNAIMRVYANHQKEPRITLQDVYGEPSSYAYKPPFWELVLAYQLLDKKIKITYMDYGRRDDGLYDDDGQPTVDVKIVDNELASFVDQAVAQKAEPAPPVKPADIAAAQAYRADIIMEDRIVYARVDGDKVYRISRRLRSNMPPHSFIDHVMSRPRTHIGRGDIEIATGSDDITELVRACGFDKKLKPIFFPNTTEKTAYYQPTPSLTAKQLKLLVEHKWDKAGKGGKA